MIYLDYHATTPCDDRVIEALLPFYRSSFGNPSSAIHEPGKQASSAVDKARKQIAKLIGAYTKEIVFTAGATESNNLTLQGLARGYKGERKQIVTTRLEHKSILVPCQELQKQGFETVYLPVNTNGEINLEAAREAITHDTLLVSVHVANNEIGTIQPIKKLAQLAHDKGAWIHCDAAQAVGKIPINVYEMDIDLLSLSGHKLYGPKGIGALFVRGGAYALPLKPLLLGGGQEWELRPGTLNVPGIVGLGKACEIAKSELAEEAQRIAKLRDRLEQIILASVQGAWCNGAINNRLPGNSNLSFPGIDAEALIVNLPELAISTGSACTSGAPEPSHVLLAIGLSRDEAYSSIRIGLGRFSTEDEINRAAKLIIKAVNRFKRLQIQNSV